LFEGDFRHMCALVAKQECGCCSHLPRLTDWLLFKVVSNHAFVQPELAHE
jgi:hypothetical protein